MLSKKKQLLFEKQAEIAKAIAHPVRIAIVDFLKDSEQCVCDIAEYVGSERSNVSKHLSVMVNAGVLEYRREGLKVIYKLKTPCILDFFSCTTACLKQQLKESEELLSAL
ncbi:MAG TPA: metalloregulator ArsR/SmtB family transcription factor [Sedimentisphaerales bacterium]|nr:metalloregulator ArsR/SmtB family transcription factor [Sedimentisphaerales bacterium]